jgi:hypothetical protein
MDRALTSHRGQPAATNASSSLRSFSTLFWSLGSAAVNPFFLLAPFVAPARPMTDTAAASTSGTISSRNLSPAASSRLGPPKSRLSCAGSAREVMLIVSLESSLVDKRARDAGV